MFRVSGSRLNFRMGESWASLRWSGKIPDCSEWLINAVSTGRRAGRQDLDRSAGIGSGALDLMGALIMRSRTCFDVRTANSDKVEWAIG